MAAVEQYKGDLVRRLGQLQALGCDPVLSLSAGTSDTEIRAVAELEVDGVIVFDDETLRYRLTGFGSLIAGAMLHRSKRLRSRGIR